MRPPTPPTPGKPVSANWGREVCDALRRMRLQAGPGIRLSQTPEGTTITAPPPPPREEPDLPMPFDIRVAKASGEWKIQAWLPADQTMLVARNGVSAINDEFAEHVEDGWVDVATLGEAPTGILLVTVDIQSTPVDESVEYSWRFVVGAPEETGIDWLDYPATNRFAEVIIRRNDTPTLVAVVVGTAVVQYHRGAISTFGMDVDSLDSDNRSLAVIEQLQAYQLWKFDDPDYRLTTPLDVSDTEHYDRVQILLRQRGDDLAEAGDGPMELHYASLGVIAQALVDAITTPHDDYKPEPSPWREAWDYYIGEGVINMFGGGDDNLTLIYNTLDNRYWVKGRGYMDCYGSSIGNSPESGPIIDLENCMLTDGDGNENVQWVARILNGAEGTASIDWGLRRAIDGNNKTSIGWGERLLRDTAAALSIDWTDREMYDSAAAVAADWDGRQLFDSAEVLAADWESRTLYHSSGRIVADWANGLLYDASADLSAMTIDLNGGLYDGGGGVMLRWRGAGARTLYGAWQVNALGGSFATPSLALNGTTVTGVATVAVVTAVDFGAQTVTTQNVKVLT